MGRFLEKFLIKNKDGKAVRFDMNKAQRHYEENRTGRDYVLKSRQLGFTTYEQLRKLEKVLKLDNQTSATIAHRSSTSKDIFKITQFAWQNLPEDFKDLCKVRYESVRELYFDANASRYYVDTDGRGGTIQDLHVSEFAFRRDIPELISSTFPAVPRDGSILLETTANGFNGARDFWLEAVAGKNSFKPHFYSWNWEDGYRLEAPSDGKWKQDYKVLARRYGLLPNVSEVLKLDDNQWYWYWHTAREQKERMVQEYPCIPEEAFLSSSSSVFDTAQVVKVAPQEAVRRYRGVDIYQEPDRDKIYSIGCDTSEGVGGDSSTIVVLDITGERVEEVANFSDSNIRPDQLAFVLRDLGYLYNTALVVPERNNSGVSTVNKLVELDYPNIYIKGDRGDGAGEVGWRTMASNRDMMIDDMIELFEDGVLEIASRNIVNEMQSFIRFENGKRGADVGYHDDNLFALFLAIQGKKYARSMEAKTKKVYRPIPIFTHKPELGALSIGVDWSPTGYALELFGVDLANGLIVGLGEEVGELTTGNSNEVAEKMRQFGERYEKKLGRAIRTYGSSRKGLGSVLREFRGAVYDKEIEGVEKVGRLIEGEYIQIQEMQERLIKDLAGYIYDRRKVEEGVLINATHTTEAMRCGIQSLYRYKPLLEKAKKPKVDLDTNLPEGKGI